MVYYKDNQWNLPELEVAYNDDGQLITKNVGSEGKDWWLELADLHEDIELIKFTDTASTDEELARLKEVNELNIPEGHSGVLGDYVHEKKFPDKANHVLKDLQNKKADESYQNYFVDLDFRLSMSEMGM